MQKVPSRSIWHAGLSLATIPLMALAMVATLAVAVELVARSNWLRTRVIPPSVGTPSRLLDQHLHQIDDLERSGVSFDCMILGNSLAFVGIDPDVVGKAFAEKTGTDLSCYDFAGPGLRADSGALLARVLQEDYDPWLVIFATSARDFVIDPKDPHIGQVPWLRYRAGELVPEGWLVDQSYAFRYFLTYLAWSDVRLRRFVEYRFDTSPRGFYLPRSGAPLTFEQLAVKARELLLEHFGTGVSEEQFAGLDRLLALHQPSHQVVILEMPCAPTAMKAIAVEAPDFELINQRVQRSTEQHGVPYWRLSEPGVIQDDGWMDLLHMNRQGAAIFSRWLGGRIADAVASGELKRPPG